MSQAPRRRATVQKSTSGWIVVLPGGSISSPFSTWAGAYAYAWHMTDTYCRYWFREWP